MGLREKALNYNQDEDGFDLSLTPEEVQAPYDAEKETLAELKEEGRVSKEDLIPGSVTHLNTSNDPASFLIGSDLEATTRPAGQAEQNRIETILNLLELIKELGFVEDEEELFTTILYGILGQLGAKQALLFYRDEGRLKLKANKGFTAEQNMTLPKRSGIERILSKDSSIHYVKEVVPKLAGEEQTWLNSLKAELIIPIMRYEEVCGFILMGKLASGIDYSLDDLLYLKLTGEALGSFHASVERILYVAHQKELWQAREKRYSTIKDFQNLVNQSDYLEPVEEKLRNLLHDEFGITMFLYLSKEGSHFSPISYRGLQKGTVSNFNIPLTDNWMWQARDQQSWYSYSDFKNDDQLATRFTAEDLQIVDTMYVLPLFFKKELNAVFLLFEVQKQLKEEDLHHLDQILHLFFWFLHSLRSDLSISITEKKSMEDPFFGLRKIIEKLELQHQKTLLPFTLFSVEVANFDRISSLTSHENAEAAAEKVEELLREQMSDNDLIANIWQGHFFGCFQGKDKPSAFLKIKTIQRKLLHLYDDNDLRPILRTRLLSRPEDEMVRPEKFLFH